MKWPQKQIQIHEHAFRQIIESSGHTAIEIRQQYSKEHPMKVVYLIDRIACYDLQYDNNHPAYSDTVQDGETFKARLRRCEYNPDFELYPLGCNDTHRATMLKYVAKQVGLID